jgi:hypothetical protein
MASEVRVSGPFFTAERTAIMTRFCRAAEEAVGQAGRKLIQERLPSQFKYDPMPPNAGFYVSQINTDRQINQVVINDSNVIYGPWLEGVGSRNDPVTRFRGYHTFRTVSRELNVASSEIAQSVLPIYLEELNGI